MIVSSRLNYDPFGMLTVGRTWSAGSDYKYGFNGMKNDDEIYGNGNSYTAEFWQYDPRLMKRWNVDPIVKPWETPYAAFSNNPILNIDPKGANANPVYDTEGTFLGTDDKGLKGEAFFMKKEDFEQGMIHDKAVEKNVGIEGLKDQNAVIKYKANYESLQARPDYDGIVTREEGIAWAKSHPNLDDDNNPKNGFKNASATDALYYDVSKMDFGKLRKSYFRKIGEPQLISLLDWNEENENSINTTYALGRTYIKLVSGDNGGKVEVINGTWNGYDWHYGGNAARNLLIYAERKLNGLNDAHGFPLYVYGQGNLNTVNYYEW